jgi:adenylate cyclase
MDTTLLSKNTSAIRAFFVVSLLIGVTLCSLQSMSFFVRTDTVVLGGEDFKALDRINFSAEVIFIMFHTMFPGIIILFRGNQKGMLFAALAWISYSIIIYVFFANFKVTVPLTAPVIGSLLSTVRILGWLTTFFEDEKEHVKDTFNHFLEPKVVDTFLKNNAPVNMVGERKNVTVFFGDLRGFTKLCEIESPEEVSFMLNQYFKKIIAIARRNGGTVDKLMGDGIMIVFGYHQESENHAENAVRAAIEMQMALFGLQAEWAERYNLDIGFGVGINTDEVVVGTVGSDEFYDHTVLGRGVNLAARIESDCPGGEVHVSENTYKLLKRTYHFKHLDNRSYTVNSDPVAIYKTGFKLAGRRAGF